MKNREKKTKPQTWFSRLEGYVLIPHELLHLVGYRLVGKQCKYEWGQPYVTPIEPLSRNERLVGVLFPFIVFVLLIILLAIPAGFAAKAVIQDGALFRFIFWLVLTHIAVGYALSTVGDLRNAYLLINNKPWHSWTPFDFLFWPFIDWAEIQKEREAKEKEEKLV